MSKAQRKFDFSVHHPFYATVRLLHCVVFLNQCLGQNNQTEYSATQQNPHHYFNSAQSIGLTLKNDK